MAYCFTSSLSMTPKERKEKTALLKRMHIAIVKHKLGDSYKLPEEKKEAFAEKVRQLCIKYNKLKEELK